MPRIVLIAVLLLAAWPAHAHKLKVFAAVVGDAAEGTVYFANAGPVPGLAVRLENAAGETLMTRRTDVDGTFAFPLDGTESRVIVAETKDGHMARFSLFAPAEAAVSAPVAESGNIEAVVARQIRPVLERLDRQEDALRLRDLIGGVGYILGLAGLVAWLRTRRDS